MGTSTREIKDKLFSYKKTITMASSNVQQVQAVAKRLEKMLETALNQLKIEQKLRKESEKKLIDIELELVNKEHRIKSLEGEIIDIRAEKEDKIKNLESTINFLQSVVVQKEKEVLALQDRSETEMESLDLGKSVEKYEETLNHLVGKSSQEDDSYVSETGEIKNENDPEEYILDESMEDLIEDASVSEEFDLTAIPKIEVKHKCQCPVCKEVFKNKAVLLIHQKETGHIVLWDCDICDKKFKTKHIAQMHKLRIHSTAMPFKCGKCEKRFKDQGSCRRHEANDSVHIKLENIKLNPNLICNICGKEFERSRRWCLDQHLLTHLANKKFPCEICGKFYRQKGYLQTHMKTCRGSKVESVEHVKVDTYETEELSDGESDASREEKCYTCTICALSFTSYRGYMSHGEKVHNAASAEHFASIQAIISSNT